MLFFPEIFSQYSEYTGTGIFMVLFFVCIVYLFITEKNETNKSVLVYGSIVLVITIFTPLLYYLYISFVDDTTYWRMWWLVPVGIGIAYVGTNLINNHRVPGFLIVALILVLGGRFVYTSDPSFKRAENEYQLDQVVIDLCDYLDSVDEEDYLNVAMPAELLTQVRQYNINIFMPYGREQLDPNWGYPSGFFAAMNREEADFECLAIKCAVNETNFIVLSENKEHINNYADYGFEYMNTIGAYEVYKYVDLQRQ